MSATEIEFVLDQSESDYESARELIKKICEDHEGKRNLHIRIIQRQPQIYDFASEIRKIVKEELDRRTADFISGFEKLNKAACYPSMTEFLHKQFPHNFKAPTENVSPKATNPDAQ